MKATFGVSAKRAASPGRAGLMVAMAMTKSVAAAKRPAIGGVEEGGGE
ncbi:hypothetical protein NBRC116594_12640 [Shimia sp. NS0008-38b]